MSREAYQVPSMGSQNLAPHPTDAPPVKQSYTCADCGLSSSNHQISPFMRCIECGSRIMLKERTKR
jgi:DNA-directed RNA polymerase subunit RPC12/RpoP